MVENRWIAAVLAAALLFFSFGCLSLFQPEGAPPSPSADSEMPPPPPDNSQIGESPNSLQDSPPQDLPPPPPPN